LLFAPQLNEDIHDLRRRQPFRKFRGSPL